MIKEPEFFKTGHRGCRGLFPENTLTGFREAIRLGVNTLELDIAVSKDLQLVVSHEPYMHPDFCLKPNGQPLLESESRTFNFFNMEYEEIKQFDCGSKIHPRFPAQNHFIPVFVMALVSLSTQFQSSRLGLKIVTSLSFRIF